MFSDTQHSRIFSSSGIYELILENTVERVIAFDRHYNVTLVNKACLQWMNATREAVMGKNIFDLVPVLKTEKRRKVLEEAMAGQSHFISDKYLISEGYFEWRTQPLRNDAGAVEGILCMVRDITPVMSQFEQINRLNAELNEKKILLNNRARLAEVILDTSHDYIVVFDKNLVYRAANKAFLDYARKEAAEVIGKNMLEVFPFADGSEFYRKIKQALLGEASVMKGMPFSLKGGYANVYISPLTFGDDIVYGVLAVTHDITEITHQAMRLKDLNEEIKTQLEKEAEQNELLNVVFNATLDYIVIFDRNHHIVQVNKKYLEYLNAEKEDIIGKNLSEIYSNLEQSCVAECLQKAWSGQTVVDHHYQFLNGKGYGRLTLVPLKEAGGQITRLMAIAQDLSDVMDKTRRLDKLNVELEWKNAELNTFNYAASHDLKSPVRKIKYFTSALKQCKGNETERLNFIEKIERSADVLESIISGLLNYYDLNFEEQKTEVNLHALLTETVENFGLTDKTVFKNTAPRLKAYKNQLTVLFNEIFTNAVKFQSKERALSITIGFDIQETAQFGHTESGAIITIQDNGIGFNPDYNDRVCNLFFRLNGQHEYGGNGIGLAICRKIAHNHHGNIEVTGMHNVGTQVKLYLPASMVA